MNGRVGHVLCAVPFPTDLLSSIRQTFSATASPEEFWQGRCDLCPGSLLEAHRHSARDFLDRRREAAVNSRSTVRKVEAIEHLKRIVDARLSEVSRSPIALLGFVFVFSIS